MHHSTTTRFRFLAVALAIGFATLTLTSTTLAATSAQPEKSTPDASRDHVPPLLWELIEFVDTATGPTPVEYPEKYTVQFLPDGVLAVGADCNRAVMSYEANGPSLQITPGVMTLALCGEDSQSEKFVEQLGYVTSFTVSEVGASDQLSLALMADGGFLKFQPSLTGVVWEWQGFQSGDGTEVKPDDPADYTLQFHKDGTISSQIDCNRGKGTYTVDGNSISIVMATTRMACPAGSLDVQFNQYLSQANSFVVRDGKLALALPADAGIATFAPVVSASDAIGTPAASE